MTKPLSQPPQPRDDPAQSQRFIDMARELGADEDLEAMDRAFERVIRTPPPKADDA
jgi:hypothetical protein